ncbi:hypothetical protein [Bradyrhizobium guangzhouense]|uniref:RraA family protein n=1 Tax=Bradyrhizobium guangzhouense TaxID=1325095 RepID=UPI001009CB58|nr:hypothetical protein [Bradyrhizobium guangzhouense]RXH10350.1 hypothetical protein EAS54_31895 [Bradyrhizobium guangzhouense]
MAMTIAANGVPKPPADVIEGFRNAPTSIISDNLSRLPGAVGLKPYHRSGKLVGAAFTVRTRPGDNLAIHHALELVGPGDVIVLGDEDGVVSFPAAGAVALLEAVRVQIRREEETLTAIREGRCQGAYGKSRAAACCPSEGLPIWPSL